MPIKKEYSRDFFKTWSREMAYILGFLFADGNIVETKRGTHFVALYTADESLLLTMRREMGSSHKISSRSSETGKVYRVQIGSREWFGDLVKLGLTPNKSKRMRWPKVPKKYVGDFVRGYFDGDGHVWTGYINKKRPVPTAVLHIGFTSGSQVFLQFLRELTQGLGVRGGSLYTVKSGTYGRLTFSTLDALKLYEIMYNTPHELHLERKKCVFERFMKERSMRA